MLASILILAISSVLVLLMSDRKASIFSFIISIIALLLIIKPITEWYKPYTENYVIPGLHQIGADLTFRVDALSAPFVALTALVFIAVFAAASWEITNMRKIYLALALASEAAVLGVFSTWNLFWFFLFWEFTLLPLFFHILYWGGERKVYAAFKFFVYTQASGLMLLVAIAMAWNATHTFDFTLVKQNLNGFALTLFAWLTLLAFFIKMPVPPFHTWLPAAHVEAPSPSSVILASLMLKMGGYAFIRLTLGIASSALSWFLVVIAFWGALMAAYAATVALAQTDFKRMVAYTSISHMSMSTMGAAIWAYNLGSPSFMGFIGSVFEMISHGFVVGALFLLSGVIKHVAHTRQIPAIRGLAFVTPIFASIIMLALFAGFGLPGTSGYPAELALVASAAGVAKLNTTGLFLIAFLLIAIGIITGYMVWSGQRMLFTRPPIEAREPRAREILPILYLLALSIILGVYPALVIEVIRHAVNGVI